MKTEKKEKKILERLWEWVRESDYYNNKFRLTEKEGHEKEGEIKIDRNTDIKRDW